MNVVLDTNVLIAAFVAHGVCHELLEHCATHHDIVASTFILDELSEKLVDKFGYADDEAGEVVRLLTSRMVLVEPAMLDSPVCRDPDDDIIPGTAIAGGSSLIVTGDKDLLVLGSVKGVRIVNPSDFWANEHDQAGL